MYNSDVETRFKADAKRRRNAKADAIREEKALYDSLPYKERLRDKIVAKTATLFERWIYQVFYDPERLLPKHEREHERASQLEDQKIIFTERIKKIAIREDKTEEEIVLFYFRKLGEFVDLKLSRISNQEQINYLKGKLNDLFEGMTIEALLEFGEPYFFERGWCVYARNISTLEQVRYEINLRKNNNDPNVFLGQGPYWAYDCTMFLINAGFEHN